MRNSPQGARLSHSEAVVEGPDVGKLQDAAASARAKGSRP